MCTKVQRKGSGAREDMQTELISKGLSLEWNNEVKMEGSIFIDYNP